MITIRQPFFFWINLFFVFVNGLFLVFSENDTTWFAIALVASVIGALCSLNYSKKKSRPKMLPIDELAVTIPKDFNEDEALYVASNFDSIVKEVVRINPGCDALDIEIGARTALLHVLQLRIKRIENLKTNGEG